jgi:hypothetical protein
VLQRSNSCRIGAAVRVRDWSVTPLCSGTLQFPTLNPAATGLEESLGVSCQATPFVQGGTAADTERPRETLPGPEGSEETSLDCSDNRNGG